ncbi:MAG: EAL domain-containing protein [Sulfuriferula sp.]|nr:EAL domain-containing protein [Sulfuriferula sp.]
MDEFAEGTAPILAAEAVPLHALIVEDSENDALLLVNYLEKAGFRMDWQRVDTEPAFLHALDQPWDIVLSDYSMPRFSGGRALNILRQHDPDVPFIFVSGTIGEITAVEGMKAGAQDYVMKGNLMRLVPAVHRELEEAGSRRQRRAAEENLRQLSLVVEQATDSVFITDPQGNIQYVNPSFERLTGYSAAETIGHTPALIKSGWHDAAFYKRMWDTILAGNSFEGTFVNCRKDGSRFYEEKVITPLLDDERHISHFVSTGRDITDRVHVEEARAQLLAILEATTDFIAIMDSKGQLRYLNHAGRIMLGLGETESISDRNIADCQPEWAAQRLLFESFPLARRKGAWHGESAIRGKDGEEIPVSQVVVTHTGKDGELAFYSTIARDITERKQFEGELQRQATHDALTGLPNRVLLQEHLARELARSDRFHFLVAVLFLDVDNFKRINDSLGHAAGDALLCSVAERLRSYLRPSDLVARYGGDEFTIVMGEIGTVEDVSLIAHKLREAFSAPFSIPGQEVYVAFSTGISIYPHDGSDAESLLKNADAAMYKAKLIGRNQYQFYAPDMNARGQELLTLETSLRRALERNEFVLYYQPQQALADNEVIGFEALIRWQHPERGLIEPVEFIAMLEETGLIVPVGAWVLREACAHYKSCRDAGYKPIRISVNVSARQFVDLQLVKMVQDVLLQHNMLPEHLEIEITESTVMQDVQSAGEILAALDALGVRLAIDDFGTGYSSLAYLKRFPLDVLKIDQIFVQDLPHDANDSAIVEASISLGHKLGLEVIAEGVATAEQLAFLQMHGCDMIQGYYFGRPMSAKDMMRFIADGKPLLG